MSIKYVNFKASNFSKRVLCFGNYSNSEESKNKNHILVIENTPKDNEIKNDIIQKILKQNSFYKIETINIEDSKNFDELVNKVKNITNFRKNYKAILFFHNNKITLPNINEYLENIKNYCFENNVIPISIGITSNCTSEISTSFSGKLFNNIYIEYNLKTIHMNLILNAINSNIIFVENIKEYVSVYNDKYYYITDDIPKFGEKILPNKFYILKYINLIILDKIMNNNFDIKVLEEINDSIIKTCINTDAITSCKTYYTVLRDEFMQVYKGNNSSLKMTNIIAEYY